MRTLLRLTFPVQTSNTAVKDNVLPQVVGKFVETYKPESCYFYPENGRRAAQFVFDLKNSDELPSIVEPFFMHLDADVSVTPCMNFDDLKAGIEKARANM